MTRGRLMDEGGQAIVVTVVFLVVLCGCVALVIDVGSWYREQRQAQATADSAALAGAQDLPSNPSGAIALAQQYANANGGGVLAADVTVTSDWEPNDTVSVTARRQAAGFFSKLFSVASVNVHASASARAGVPQQALGVAPIVVNKANPLLSGPGCPCFDSITTLPLGKTGAPGAFGLIDLANSTGNTGDSTLGNWIENGFDQYLPLGKYDSDPGASFNSSNITNALSDRIGTELLFPVYDTLGGTGSNAQYNVIGWVAFHLQGYDSGNSSNGNGKGGNSASLTGYFTRVIWQGIQSKTNQNIPDFGVYSVSIVK